LQNALDAAARGDLRAVDARMPPGSTEVVREPLLPVCPWCSAPLRQSVDGALARCGCGLP
jgi:hypothetical protein